MERILHLKDVIDAETFQKIQDNIAVATEMSIITVDFKGKPITKHSGCSDFCKLMRGNSKYSQLCEKCDSRGGVEAARLEKPYIYICHRGLVDFATPIIVKGQYLGSVMAGQVLMKEDKNIDLENIVARKTEFDEFDEGEKNNILSAYKRLPIVEFKKIQAVADMMFDVSNYIVKETVLKILEKELSEKNIKFMEATKAKIELEKEYKTSQLKALQSQINPHFLFNVLNSISSLAIVENAPKTQEVIYNLSTMLRYTLKKATKIVTLTEELDYVTSYLNLQKIRFEDRLNYDIDINSKYRDIKIPFMIAQTFVENAVVHGLETKEDGGYIKIYTKEDEEFVKIYVEDNGTGISKEKLKELKEDLKLRSDNNLDKIGINNVNKRMFHYYKDDYQINIDSKIREGTLVEIIIPKEV